MYVIRLPNITGGTPQEQISQINSYLYQLVGDLQYSLSDTAKSVEEFRLSLPNPSGVKTPEDIEKEFNDLKALIIKSADIIDAYSEKIIGLIDLSGKFVAQSDFGDYVEVTNARIDASDKEIASTVEKLALIESDVDFVRKETSAIKQTAEEISLSVEDTIIKLENLSVGGTNLLIDTDAPSLTKVAAEYNRTFTSMVIAGDATGVIEPLSDSPCGTKNAVRISIVNAGAGGIAGYRFYRATQENTLGISFVPGEQYTLSCYARALDGEPQINLAIWGLTLWGWKAVPTEWTKFSLTVTATEAFNSKTDAWAVFRSKEDIVGTIEFTGFKLEKGNKATDWSPSPEEAQYAIENILVGARNLQLGTQFWDDTCIRLPGNAEINGEEITIPSNTYTELEKIQVKNGEVYTISCDVKSDVAYDGNSFLIQFFHESGTRLSYEWASGSIGTDWSRIVKTIPVTRTEEPLFLGIGLRANSGVEGVDCTLTYRHMMVERGTKATDWTPAPEDTQVQIDGVVEDVGNQGMIIASQESRIAGLEISNETISAAVEKVTIETKTTLDGVIQSIEQLENQASLAITEEAVNIAITEKLQNADGIHIKGKGFGFDKDGLSIESPGKQMRNLLDDTGMYVTRSGNPVLTVNDQGTVALNLTAEQYLIAGSNARFEDYEGNRTGCFHIGKGEF